ncbi:MAG: glycosyltransferase family 2 protein [Actinobacteria bacterium]|nr:MAG: glycosyltransferase family 2 protein [Actinomycetota bacterium]
MPVRQDFAGTAPPTAATPGPQPPGRAPRTLVIVPALNEAESLAGVLLELGACLPDAAVLVVDDGSTDGTADVARAAGAIVAQLPFNLGVGGALRTGFRYAIRHGYERAVQLDGDGQHDPGEIAALLAGLEQGADMVIGSRFAEAVTRYDVGRLRGHAMRILRLSVHLLSGHRFSDTSSGFRAFSAPLLEFFARNYPVEYLGDTAEALLLACYGGFQVVEVPVRMRLRAGGVPSTRNVKLAYHYLRVLVSMFSRAPAPLRRRELRRVTTGGRA